MRISKVRIKNFRCLADVEVRFDQVTTLIGPNGVGKSTVLRALDWFFNGTKPGALLDEDRTGGAEGDVVVEVEFDQLTDADREELGKHVPAQSERCVIWKIRRADGTELMSANARAFQGFAWIREVAGAAEMRVRYQQVRTDLPDLGLPAVRSKPEVEAALKAWELANPDRLDDAEVAVTNLFGFNGQAKMSGLFDYVFVSADMRVEEEAKDGRSALVGRILERTVDRTAADADIKALAADVESRQDGIFAKNFAKQLSTLSASLSEAVGQYTVGRAVKVQATKQKIEPPRTQFSLSVTDSSVDTPVEKQGHGFQRTLLIAALQLLAKHGNAERGSGAICLAIEEPELFQHPVQARTFASVLRTLAEDDAQNIQVAYATHSPHFIDPSRFEQVRRVTRDPKPEKGCAPTVTVRSASVESVEKRLVGYFDNVRNRLPAIAETALAEALFSSGAILAEGSSDKAVITGLAEKSSKTSLLNCGVTVVDMNGKSNLFIGHAVLAELGVPCYVVFDGDLGLEGRKRLNAQPDKEDPETWAKKFEADLAAALAKNTKDNRNLLQYLGTTPSDYPETCAHASYAAFVDTIEPLLAAEWPGWQEKLSEVMKDNLIAGRKNALAYLLTARQITSEPPEFFTALLRHARNMVSADPAGG
ncbi:AAA family ATPase [Actinosynnema mirum]|uniref:ATP-dependent endonuclease of the OLD family-like protein n=1 Tax=Actinosynnema mirum (strain ATCC 29888 / DSM 43827 / JCM 3225 / NBRC 14064 / NCIMB 13271 / NRRL B-12336 / IMRU 3971 / 101) TaxID=446462 RepID=C6WN28_ACTMD|nr:AAA family ATPase [Actinosynnema mirum]ACU38541.1 ATP-dependent endonuclease of the OLD family- like protein [Actinosynnema mirum DSM 43827]